MKKSRRQKVSRGAFFASAILAVAAVSCDFSVPETVSVKSYGAEYSMPLGHTDFSIAERFSAETVQDAISGGDSNVCVYELNPSQTDDAVVEYVMNYPIEAQELSTATSGVDLSTLISSASVSNPIELNSFHASLDTGINFKKILDSFAKSDDSDSERTDYGYIFDSIAFRGIEAFAYIQVAGIDKKNASFTGKIAAGESEVSDWTTFSGSEDTPVLADSDSDGEFVPVDTDIDLSKKADEDGIITDDSFLAEDAYSVELDGEKLTDYINGTPDTDEDGREFYRKHENFIINYTLRPILEFSSDEEIAAFKANLDNGEKLMVNVNIVIRFPLKIEVLNDIEIDDLLDLAGNAVEEDLLKRDDGEETSWAKYADLVESLECEYCFTNTTGLLFESKIVSNEVDGQKLMGDKEVAFNGTEQSFQISGDEVRNIFNKSPFKPKIYAKISKTEGEDGFLEISRGARFGARAIFKATTGGTVEIWNRNE